MNRGRISLIGIVITLAIVGFKLLFAPKFTNPETGSSHRVGLTPQQEQQLGLQSYQQVLREESANVVRAGSEVDMTKRVARRLASAAAEKGDIKYNWKLSVVRSNQANAFCLPGGEIVVYTGILPITQDDAGLATVMGHEMAHATGRHGAQRIYQQNLQQTFLSGVGYSLGNMDYNQQQMVMGLLGAATKYGGTLPFGRGHESEADHVGLLYMARAGFDPHQSIEFWQRMEQKGGSQPPEFMSTHPSHGTRIQQLREWMPEAEKEYANSKMRQTEQPTESTGM